MNDKKNTTETNSTKLHIAMSYIFSGDVYVDIPAELLEGKSDEEKLQIAYDYAQEHIDEIGVAENAEYVGDSDWFELEDCNFVNEDDEDDDE